MTNPRASTNRRGVVITLLAAAAILSLSTLLVVFSVPLYRLFCAATGIGGGSLRDAMLGSAGR